jgi:hypothetical protein
MWKGEKVVMYDSPDAASYQTGISGWVSRDGFIWRDDEHMARWSGCTHRTCEVCGTVYRKNAWCDTCREKRMAEQFASYPVEKWDGETPCCVFDSDIYFFDEDSLLDYIAENESETELRICKCKPVYLSPINEDNWCDDLPEDGELPDEVVTALESLNKAISESGPVSWWEDKIAIDVEDLRKSIIPQESN